MSSIIRTLLKNRVFQAAVYIVIAISPFLVVGRIIWTVGPSSSLNTYQLQNLEEEDKETNDEVEVESESSSDTEEDDSAVSIPYKVELIKKVLTPETPYSSNTEGQIDIEVREDGVLCSWDPSITPPSNGDTLDMVMRNSTGIHTSQRVPVEGESSYFFSKEGFLRTGLGRCQFRNFTSESLVIDYSYLKKFKMVPNVSAKRIIPEVEGRVYLSEGNVFSVRSYLSRKSEGEVFYNHSPDSVGWSTERNSYKHSLAFVNQKDNPMSASDRSFMDKSKIRFKINPEDKVLYLTTTATNSTGVELGRFEYKITMYKEGSSSDDSISIYPRTTLSSEKLYYPPFTGRRDSEDVSMVVTKEGVICSWENSTIPSSANVQEVYLKTKKDKLGRYDTAGSKRLDLDAEFYDFRTDDITGFHTYRCEVEFRRNSQILSHKVSKGMYLDFSEILEMTVLNINLGNNLIAPTIFVHAKNTIQRDKKVTHIFSPHLTLKLAVRKKQEGKFMYNHTPDGEQWSSKKIFYEVTEFDYDISSPRDVKFTVLDNLKFKFPPTEEKVQILLRVENKVSGRLVAKQTYDVILRD